MGDISIKGSNKSILRGPHGFGPKPFLNRPGQAQGTHGGKAKGGRIGLQYGGPPNRGRTNLLEQLGRVEAERSNPNRRAEISRVHGELNRGYAKGGRAGFVHGSVAKVAKIAARKFRKPPGVFKVKGKKTHGKDVPTMAAEGGRIGFKKGTDKKWMQKVSASIKKRGTKGKCTPITKPGCTGRAKALAKTFKKIAARRKG